MSDIATVNGLIDDVEANLTAEAALLVQLQTAFDDYVANTGNPPPPPPPPPGGTNVLPTEVVNASYAASSTADGWASGANSFAMTDTGTVNVLDPNGGQRNTVRFIIADKSPLVGKDFELSFTATGIVGTPPKFIMQVYGAGSGGNTNMVQNNSFEIVNGTNTISISNVTSNNARFEFSLRRINPTTETFDLSAFSMVEV